MGGCTSKQLNNSASFEDLVHEYSSTPHFRSVVPLDPENETIQDLIQRIEDVAISADSWNVPAMKEAIANLIPTRLIFHLSLIPSHVRNACGDWKEYREALIREFPSQPLHFRENTVTPRIYPELPQHFEDDGQDIEIHAVELDTEENEANDEDDAVVDANEEEEEDRDDGAETVFISQYIKNHLSSNEAYELLDSFIAGEYEATTKPIVKPPGGALVFYNLEKLAENPEYAGLDRQNVMKKIRLDGYRYNRSHSGKSLTADYGSIYRLYNSVYNRDAPTKVDHRFLRYEWSRDSYVMFHYIGDHLYAREIAKTAHGNSKNPSKKFVRANPALIKKIDEQLKEGKQPAKVYRSLVNTDGDESEKPNNLKVVQNRADVLNRQKRIDEDLLAGVLRLNSALMYDDCEEPFVAYMEIMRLRIHLYCKPAISELIRAYGVTKTAQQLEFDTQFSVSGMYLSNLTWRNPVLEGRPAITIAHYLHEFKNKRDHEEFIRELLSHHPRLKNIRVVIGSDAEFDFSNVWPGSEAIHCWLHWSKDVQSFCYRNNINFNSIARDLDELKYCDSEEELLQKWSELKEERAYSAKLITYMEKTSLQKFIQYSAIWHLRKAGLPEPRNGYTTNTAESVNALVARLQNNMASLDVCVASLFWLSVFQYNETVRAWHGNGNWQLAVKYIHLKNDDSIMPKLMACPEPEEILDFVRGKRGLCDSGEKTESKGVSNTPLIALAHSLIASKKVSVVQGGTVLVEHNSRVFSVTTKIVRNKTSYLCACKVTSCLHSIAAKIFMGVPVEDMCKTLTLSGIKRSMRNPGDGKSGTKKGRAADKKVDKMIARAEKREKAKKEEEDGEEEQEEEEEEEEEEFLQDEEEESEGGEESDGGEVKEIEQNDEIDEEEVKVEDSFNDDMVFTRHPRRQKIAKNDMMMGGEDEDVGEDCAMKMKNRKKKAITEEQAVDNLGALFDAVPENKEDMRFGLELTLTGLRGISRNKKRGTKGTIFPAVSKWADDEGKITLSCPIDGFLAALIFANEKNPNFYRNLPTGDLFSKACRAYITGSENVDQKKRIFVRSLFEANRRGVYNLFGEESDKIVAKAEKAASTIVKTFCTTCLTTKDSFKSEYIIKKQEDQEWEDAYKSTLFTQRKAAECKKKPCGTKELKITVPDSTWMLPIDVSQVVPRTVNDIDALPRKIIIRDTEFELNSVSCYDDPGKHYSMIIIDGDEYIFYDGMHSPLLKKIKLDDLLSVKEEWQPKMAYYLKL